MEEFNTPTERINNLLSMYQGECPFERLKGMDPTLIDMPASFAKPKIIEHVKWLLKTYEPDLTIISVSIYDADSNIDGVSFGDYVIKVEIEE